MQRPRPRSTLFPYTTLFRSKDQVRDTLRVRRQVPFAANDNFGMETSESILDNFRSITAGLAIDRKSTRLNSSHSQISYAVFCLKKKKKINNNVKLIIDNDPTSLEVCVLCPESYMISLFFFNATTTTEIYTLSLHDALPI